MSPSARPSPLARLADNLDRVRARMAEACHAAGRPAGAVRLVAVTKYGDVGFCRALIGLGERDFGESRPQQLWAKAAALAGEASAEDAPAGGEAEAAAVRWHVIGPLQRNKLARTLPLVHLLHVGDRWPLLEAASAEQVARGRPPVATLLEVNVSGDPSKGGFAPDELPAVVARLPGLPGVAVRGLMAMAGYGTTPDQARRQFAAVRELRDRLRPGLPDGTTLDELSLGMSGDYPEAILEGATIIRVGSALTEGVGPFAGGPP